MKHTTVVYFFVVIALLVFVFTKAAVGGVNDGSRVATISSLVERGTWSIDATGYEGPDRVFWDGHFYSSKPPVLSALGAAVYYPLHTVFGLELDATSEEPQLAYYIITLIIVGGAYWVLLFFFFRSLVLVGISQTGSMVTTGVLALSTILLPYMSTFNNHVVGAGLLSAAWYFLLCARGATRSRWRCVFLCGLCVGFAAVIDVLVAAFFVVAFFVYLVWALRYRGVLLAYVLGLLPAVVMHGVLNYSFAGTIVPFYLLPGAYYFPGSYWYSPTRVDVAGGSRLAYAFRVLFGTHGFFSYTPVLLLSVWAGVRAWTREKYAKELILLAGTSLGVVLYVVLLTKGFAGYSYGARWLVALTPFVLWPLGFLFADMARFPKKIFLGSVLVSTVVAFVGLVDPWTNTFYIAESGPVYFPFVGNLGALMHQFGLVSLTIF